MSIPLKNRRGRNKQYFDGEDSILVKETTRMGDYVRVSIQQNIKRIHGAAVEEHQVHEDGPAAAAPVAPEGELQNDIPRHPILQEQQRFDGVDNELNPVPSYNSNEKIIDAYNLRLQKQKKLDLTNSPSPSSTPSPRPGR